MQLDRVPQDDVAHNDACGGVVRHIWKVGKSERVKEECSEEKIKN